MAAAAEPFPGIPNLVFDKTIKMVLPDTSREANQFARDWQSGYYNDPRVPPYLLSEKTGTLKAYIENVFRGNMNVHVHALMMSVAKELLPEDEEVSEEEKKPIKPTLDDIVKHTLAWTNQATNSGQVILKHLSDTPSLRYAHGFRAHFMNALGEPSAEHPVPIVPYRIFQMLITLAQPSRADSIQIVKKFDKVTLGSLGLSGVLAEFNNLQAQLRASGEELDRGEFLRKLTIVLHDTWPAELFASKHVTMSAIDKFQVDGTALSELPELFRGLEKQQDFALFFKEHREQHRANKSLPSTRGSRAQP